MSDRPARLERLCADLRIPFDADRFRALFARANSRPSVAILGLVSRGKSTLVNELIGVSLCPVSAKGETAATIEISHGQPKLQAWDKNGNPIAMGTDTQEFVRRLRRDATPRVTRASFSGEVRLPPGVVLVDTPGIDDAATVSQQLGYLERHWTLSGSSAAVVVVSVPPGLGRTDRDFIDAARQVFGKRMVVAVKATDSSLDDESLQEVADEIERHLGESPIVLPNHELTGPWGTGKTAQLDNAISRLMRQGTAVADQTIVDLNDMVQLICAAIGSLPEDRLDQLVRHEQAARQAHPDVGRKVTERIAALQRVRETRLRAEQERQRQEQTRFLDEQAHQLARLLPRQLQQLDDHLHGGTVRELVKLARQGSAAALDGLSRLSGLDTGRRIRLGIDLAALMDTFPLAALASALGGCDLSDAEAKALVSAARSAADTQILERQTRIRAYLAAATFPTLKNLRSSVTAPEMTALLDGTLVQYVLQRLERAEARAVKAVNAADGVNLVKAMLRMESLIGDGAIVRWNPSIHRRLASRHSRLTTQAIDRLTAVLEWERTLMLASASTITPLEVTTKAIQLEPITKWLRAHARQLPEVVADFAPQGPLSIWAAQSQMARLRASDDADSHNAMVRSVNIGSYALWGFSLLALAQGCNPDSNDGDVNGVLIGSSILMWVIALVAWLVTKDAPTQTWNKWFRAPAFPLAALPIESDPQAKRLTDCVNQWLERPFFARMRMPAVSPKKRLKQWYQSLPDPKWAQPTFLYLYSALALVVLATVLIIGHLLADDKPTLRVAPATTRAPSTTAPPPTDATPRVKVGDTGPGGGIVFYVHPEGQTFECGDSVTPKRCRYLEAWTTDLETSGGDVEIEWSGNTNTLVGTSTIIGAGYKNTVDAVAQDDTADRAITLSESFTNNGFSDWWLPSRDELNEMWTHRQEIGIPTGSYGLPIDEYWSSSEFFALNIWHWSDRGPGANVSKKSGFARVRPVRGF